MHDAIPFPTPVIERLAALGIPGGGVLDRAGLPATGPLPAHLTTAQFFALWEEVERVAPGPGFALELAADVVARRYDRSALVACHAATAREALQKYAKYKRIRCPEDVTVEERAGEARVRAHWSLATGAAPRLVVDATFAALLALLRAGTERPIVPLRVELARRRRDGPLLRAHFGAEIVFDAPEDRLVFAPRTLDTPFVSHDAALVALLAPELEAELARRGRGFLDEVRLALCRKMCGERPSLEKVAAELGVSTRTLQRRLGEAGTTYQRVLDGVRAQAAKHLLAATDLASAEVAYVLGFDEHNSFTRAFAAWEGTTPNRFRAATHRRAPMAAHR